MNVNDSQIAAKVLSNYNYEILDKLKDNMVDIILVKSTDSSLFSSFISSSDQSVAGSLKCTPAVE